MSKKQSKYLDLYDWLKEQVASRKFAPGQKIYSENVLKDMFRISRQTVRHAIGDLEKEGILIRIRGSGTYVNDMRQTNLEKRTRISVVTTYVDGYIFPKMIQGIENILFEHGYSVQIAFTNNQNSREKIILEDILSRDEVAGVIVETTKSGIPNPNLKLYKTLQKRGIPVIFLNSYYPSLSIPHVSLNDKMAGAEAAQYLIGMGHRRIGGIFKLDDGQGHLRYAGYMKAMQKAGIEANDTFAVWIDTVDMLNLEKCRNYIMERLKDCTAVICYNDQVAYGFMEILKKEGIAVPENISIISIDDSELAIMGETPLTSIPHPTDRLGEQAALNLLKVIENPSYDAVFEFDAKIIERDSVRRWKEE